VINLRRINPATKNVWQPGPDAVVCSQHFLSEDFSYKWGVKHVRHDRVPTIFSFKSHVCRRKPPKDRRCPVGESKSYQCVQMEVDDHQPSASDSGVICIAEVDKSEHSYSVTSPTKLRNQVNVLVQRLHTKTNYLRNTRRRESRLRGKLANVLTQLKNKHLLSTQSQDLLNAYKDIPVKLFEGKCGRAFSDEQKQFATTLHYYSPAAYIYLRRRLKSLPSPRTIRQWLSKYNGEPGLTQQSFDTIAGNACRDSSWEYKICALHMDEMEIKKHIDYDRWTGKTHGFTDIGSGK
jgi:hypothetical protein